MLSSKEKYELYKPKKFLGQNFLVDKNIAKKIVDSLEVKPDDIVVEIGPGQGVLTRYLASLTENLIAVELDKSLYEKLHYEYGNKIKLIQKDFLKMDLAKDIGNFGRENTNIKIIGNIPYNITSEILFKLYESKVKIELCVMMMQKEVAERLTAMPDTKKYGILSVMTQVICSVKILFNVPPAAFFPKPKVNSSVIRLVFENSKYEIKDKNLFNSLVRESFGKRRKTMKNSLKDFFMRNEIEFEKIDFDFSRRPENVSVTEFISLANALKDETTKTDKSKTV